MKNFVKYVLATVTGLVITIGLVVLLFLGIFSSMSQKKEVKIKDESVLHLKLNYSLKDRTEDDIMDIIGALQYGMDKPVGLIALMNQIDHASTDPKIEGIFMDLTMIDAGYAKLTELRNAIIRFKESGKFVIAYSDLYVNSTYYLASAADKVYLNPKGTFLFNGMIADVMFIRGAMEKLGIEMQPIKRGKYKGAVEPFILDSLSTSNREQIDAYLNSIYNEFIKGIAEQRGIPFEELDHISDEMLVKLPIEAKKYNLVDDLLYRDEVYAVMNEHLEKETEDKINFVNPGKYASSIKKAGADGKIAVVFAEGGIVDGKGENDEIGAETFAAALRDIRLDDDIKAVVLRINSGGGSALASEIIWREAELLRKVKPLIVSMGDYAASGGYYIACMADSIFALPNTITGSIGVFGLYPNLEKLLENIGVNVDYVGTGNRSDFGRVDRPLSEADFAVIDTLVGSVYQGFLERVAEGRSMSLMAADSLGQGRVWTGEMAKSNGLIDEFGGFDNAVKAAAFKANIETYNLVAYPKRSNPLSEILSFIDADQAKADFLRSELGDSYRYYELIKIATNLKGVQALMPFTIVVK